MMNIAFAGLRHDHIYEIHKEAVKNPLYNIVGAFEENEDAKIRAKEVFGLNCNYSSYGELLSDPEVDVVALGGCYADRGEMAIRALKAGKHVIADKPLCTKLSELDEIEHLAKEKGKKVSCMYTMRFEPKIVALKALVQSGALGEINNVSFGGQHPLMYGRRPMWYFEEGGHGGVITDIAIHGIDILSYALGLEIEKINAARCWNKFASEAKTSKDSAQMMLTAKNGAGILADVSYAIPDGVEFALPYYWQFFIWGTKGTMEFAYNDKELRCFVSGSAEPVKIKEIAPKHDYLTDFYHLVQGEGDVILPMEDTFSSMREALKIQELADKAER